MFSGWNYNFDIFWEKLRKPEGNIGLLSWFLVGESIDCFDDNNYFLIDFLGAVDNLLFFDFWGGYIEPVGKELSDIFLEEIDALFHF